MTTVHCPVRTTSPQGHNPSLGCREAVETADYTAYRDKAPLVPDSAVMVRELFAETIDLFAEEVRKDLGEPMSHSQSDDPHLAAHEVVLLARASHYCCCLVCPSLSTLEMAVISMQLMFERKKKKSVEANTQYIWKPICLVLFWSFFVASVELVENACVLPANREGKKKSK